MIVEILKRDPYLLIDTNDIIDGEVKIVGFDDSQGKQLKDLLVVVNLDDELLTMKYLDVLDRVHPYISQKLRKRLQ